MVRGSYSGGSVSRSLLIDLVLVFPGKWYLLFCSVQGIFRFPVFCSVQGILCSILPRAECLGGCSADADRRGNGFCPSMMSRCRVKAGAGSAFVRASASMCWVGQSIRVTTPS